MKWDGMLRWSEKVMKGGSGRAEAAAVDGRIEVGASLASLS